VSELLKRVDHLLDPRLGIKRGIIDQCEQGKGGKDPDKMLVPVAVGEIREVHAVLAALRAIHSTSTPGTGETANNGLRADR